MIPPFTHYSAMSTDVMWIMCTVGTPENLIHRPLYPENISNPRDKYVQNPCIPDNFIESNKKYYDLWELLMYLINILLVLDLQSL